MKLENMKRNEDTEQMRVMDWAANASVHYPELRWLHHIPNGGARNAREAVKLKRMGVKRGVSDLHLPYARGCYHGLYIEMKSGRNTATREQMEFLQDMDAARQCVAVCHDAQSAIEVIRQYLELAPRERLAETLFGGDMSVWWEEHVRHMQSAGPLL